MNITDSQTVHMGKTHFLLKIGKSKPSLGILEIFQHRSALPNMEFNCAVIFFDKNVWNFKLYYCSLSHTVVRISLPIVARILYQYHFVGTFPFYKERLVIFLSEK